VLTYVLLFGCVALRARKSEDTAMRSESLDEIGDTLFAVAVAGAIGLSAANLAIQVNKERAAFDVSAASHRLGQLAYPQQRGRSDAGDHEPVGQFNF
jgi:hypothetical protein